MSPPSSPRDVTRSPVPQRRRVTHSRVGQDVVRVSGNIHTLHKKPSKKNTNVAPMPKHRSVSREENRSRLHSTSHAAPPSVVGQEIISVLGNPHNLQLPQDPSMQEINVAQFPQHRSDSEGENRLNLHLAMSQAASPSVVGQEIVSVLGNPHNLQLPQDPSKQEIIVASLLKYRSDFEGENRSNLHMSQVASPSVVGQEIVSVLGNPHNLQLPQDPSKEMTKVSLPKHGSMTQEEKSLHSFSVMYRERLPAAAPSMVEEEIVSVLGNPHNLQLPQQQREEPIIVMSLPQYGIIYQDRNTVNAFSKMDYENVLPPILRSMQHNQNMNQNVDTNTQNILPNVNHIASDISQNQQMPQSNATYIYVLNNDRHGGSNVEREYINEIEPTMGNQKMFNVLPHLSPANVHTYGQHLSESVNENHKSNSYSTLNETHLSPPLSESLPINQRLTINSGPGWGIINLIRQNDQNSPQYSTISETHLSPPLPTPFDDHGQIPTSVESIEDYRDFPQFNNQPVFSVNQNQMSTLISYKPSSAHVDENNVPIKAEFTRENLPPLFNSYSGDHKSPLESQNLHHQSPKDQIGLPSLDVGSGFRQTEDLEHTSPSPYRFTSSSNNNQGMVFVTPHPPNDPSDEVMHNTGDKLSSSTDKNYLKAQSGSTPMPDHERESLRGGMYLHQVDDTDVIKHGEHAVSSPDNIKSNQFLTQHHLKESHNQNKPRPPNLHNMNDNNDNQPIWNVYYPPYDPNLELNKKYPTENKKDPESESSHGQEYVHPASNPQKNLSKQNMNQQVLNSQRHNPVGRPQHGSDHLFQPVRNLTGDRSRNQPSLTSEIQQSASNFPYVNFSHNDEDINDGQNHRINGHNTNLKTNTELNADMDRKHHQTLYLHSNTAKGEDHVLHDLHDKKQNYKLKHTLVDNDEETYERPNHFSGANDGQYVQLDKQKNNKDTIKDFPSSNGIVGSKSVRHNNSDQINGETQIKQTHMSQTLPGDFETDEERTPARIKSDKKHSHQTADGKEQLRDPEDVQHGSPLINPNLAKHSGTEVEYSLPTTYYSHSQPGSLAPYNQVQQMIETHVKQKKVVSYLAPNSAHSQTIPHNPNTDANHGIVDSLTFDIR